MTDTRPLQVVLRDILYHQMLDHALSRPRLEVCGLLGANGGLIKSYYPVANIARQPQRAFLMDPAGQIQAMRAMRGRGEELAAIFHSHPYTPARPSARDRREARYPDVYYFIASLRHSRPELKCFHFNGKRFRAVMISH